MPEDKTPLPAKNDESKPVVWTPEDASRFLTAAIHEAQRPLAEALKQRPMTARAMTIIIGVMVLAGIGIAVLLSNQIDKAEQETKSLRASRETVLTEKIELQAKSSVLEERLSVAQTSIAAMRLSEEDLRKTRNDLQRFRRQNELLRSQISGLEMEKMALARQLEAIRAMAIEDELSDEGDLEFEADDKSATPQQEAAPAAPITSEEPREDAENAILPGEGFRIDEPSVVEPATEPVIDVEVPQESAAVAPENPADAGAEHLDLEIEVTPSDTVQVPLEDESATAEVVTPETAGIPETPAEEPAVQPEISEPAPEPESAPVADEAPKTDDNPPTLYEATQMFETTSEAYGEALAVQESVEAEPQDQAPEAAESTGEDNEASDPVTAPESADVANEEPAVIEQPASPESDAPESEEGEKTDAAPESEVEENGEAK